MSRELHLAATFWTLRSYPSKEREWSLDEKFAEMKRQGFEFVVCGLIPELRARCAAHGLGCLLAIDADASNYRQRLEAAAEWKPRRLNVQLCDHDTPPEEAARVWIARVALAEKLGIAIDLELHRDTATETPEKARAIADLFKRATGRPIRFCFDFSHFAVTKHLTPPFAPRLLDDWREEIAEARLIHFRPFNGHHAQVPATDGNGRWSPEFADYLEFVDAFLGLWSSIAARDAVMFGVPENGPKVPGGYGLSCFPDVWQDALVVRREVAKLWAKHHPAP